MEVNTVNCLICASPCSPDFVINKSNTPLAFGRDDEVIEEHLKAIFILRKILKISPEILCQFLVKGNGQFYPELWFNVCESCGESVTQFYVVLKEISKLERKLTTIQTELKGKIESTIHVENTDFVWGKIREEALKGFNQVATEKYNFLIVKTESKPAITTESHNQTKYPDEDDYKFENGGITNHYQHEEDEENVDFSIDDDSHSSYQPSSSSINQMTDDDDEEEEIKFVTDFDPSDFQPSRTNCTNFLSSGPSNSDVSTVSRAYFYACHQCSFQSNTKAGFEAHQRLHAEGSGAVTCRVCDRPVLPKMMARHNASHPIIGAYRQRKRAKTVLKNGARPLELGPTPGGSSSSTQPPGKYYYRCIQCPYENNSSLAFEIHSKLHEEGSGAVICGECGLYVDPKRMAFHRTRRHNYSNGSYVKKNRRHNVHK